MNLLTDRLILRSFEESDGEPLHEVRSDPEVGRYSDFHSKTEEETRGWLSDTLAYDRAHSDDPARAYNLAIVLKTEDRLIGWIGIGRPSRPSLPGELDFGYALSRRYWGRDYMTEAVQALLAFGFRMLHAQRIFAECQPPNVASARVMEKAGMRYEGRFLVNGVEHLRYAIHASEWSGSPTEVSE
jgi:[ribosomal protein S5]-alanine N-acetyltransferase